jgi:hypothetical protein
MRRSFYDGRSGCEHVPFHVRGKMRMFVNHKWTMGADVGKEHIVSLVPGIAERDCRLVSSRGIAKRYPFVFSIWDPG